MKTLRFVCHDEQPNVPPLIATFTVDDNTETEDLIETFGKALSGFIPASEDCPPIRYAADKVCAEYGASVEFYEVDQEFGVAVRDRAVCSECGVILSDEHDRTSPCPYNTGFSDEAEACWACHTHMLENCIITQCESCRKCFTYSHLIRNNDVGADLMEICPYCGGIWSGDDEGE